MMTTIVAALTTVSLGKKEGKEVSVCSFCQKYRRIWVPHVFPEKKTRLESRASAHGFSSEPHSHETTTRMNNSCNMFFSKMMAVPTMILLSGSSSGSSGTPPPRLAGLLSSSLELNNERVKVTTTRDVREDDCAGNSMQIKGKRELQKRRESRLNKTRKTKHN